MRRPLSLTVALFFALTSVFAQETCEADTVDDPNSITKCSVKDVEDALNQIEGKKLRTRIKRKKVVNGTSLSSNDVNQVSKLDTQQAEVDKVKNATNKLAVLRKIPFYLVDQIPLFSKCENSPLVKQNKCFEKQMAKHIANNFSYPKEALTKKQEGKILVQFTIDKDGNVIDIKKKGPENSDILKAEAERLISKLPKFIPGTHDGKKVLVKYALPIIFKLPKNI